MYKVGYYSHTNILFLQSKLLKLIDLVEFSTAQLLYKANKGILPENIQKLFTHKEGGYNLRGCSNFKRQIVRTTRKSLCVSVCGVKLWNRMDVELKQCPNIHLFKSRYKKCILSRYKEESSV